MLRVTGLFVRLDLHVIQKNLPPLDAGKGPLKIGMSEAYTLNLRSSQLESCFKAL